MNIKKVYAKMARKYPDADYFEIEERVRKKLFEQKLLICIPLFIVSTIAAVIVSVYYNDVENDISAALKLIGGAGSIAAVCIFAKALHDPLTPDEAMELIEKERIEKNGI